MISSIRLHCPGRAALCAALCVALVWAAGLAGAAGPPLDAAGERQRIAAERAAVESAHTRAEARCRERFAVTTCIEQARQLRRDALGGLREQELLLADDERKRRAAERMLAIDRNRIEAESRPPAAAPATRARPRSVDPAASAVPALAAPATAPAPAPEPAPAPAPAPGPSKEAAAAAAQRASAAAQRQLEITRDLREVQRRQAEREAAGRAVSPLPRYPASTPAR